MAQLTEDMKIPLVEGNPTNAKPCMMALKEHNLADGLVK